MYQQNNMRSCNQSVVYIFDHYCLQVNKAIDYWQWHSPTLAVSVFVLWLLLLLALFGFFRVTGLGAVVSLLARIISDLLVVLIVPVSSARRWALGPRGCFCHRGRRVGLVFWRVMVLVPALVLRYPGFSALLVPPPVTAGLLVPRIAASPPLRVPALPGPAIVVVVVMVRAPVTIALPRVGDGPFIVPLRVPVPVVSVMRRKAAPVRPTMVPVVAVVPAVPIAIAIAVSLVTPVPVVSVPVSAPVRVQSVSLPVSAPVRVRSVSLPVSGRLSFIASGAGLVLVLLLSVRASFAPCRWSIGLWWILGFSPTCANLLWSSRCRTGALGAVWWGG